MPLKPWQEQMLRATYEPEDIDAALREDPHALDRLWADTSRQLRDDDEQARLGHCEVCHRAATDGRCADCHAVADLVPMLTQPLVYVAGTYEHTPLHGSGGAGLVLVDSDRVVATAALSMQDLPRLRSRGAGEKVIELATLWAPGVPIVCDEPMMAKNARYRGIDARAAEPDEGVEVPRLVRELADEGARGVVTVRVGRSTV